MSDVNLDNLINAFAEYKEYANKRLEVLEEVLWKFLDFIKKGDNAMTSDNMKWEIESLLEKLGSEPKKTIKK